MVERVKLSGHPQDVIAPIVTKETDVTLVLMVTMVKIVVSILMQVQKGKTL